MPVHHLLEQILFTFDRFGFFGIARVLIVKFNAATLRCFDRSNVSSSKSVAHAAELDSNPKDLQN